MYDKTVIEKTKKYVKEKLEGEGSGHDWWHIYRVWNLAKKIAEQEKADMFVVELAALLHDLADYKLYKGDEIEAKKMVIEWLEKLKIEKNVVSHVLDIIEQISFSKNLDGAQVKTKEGMIVQDADRLDAIGAIGIARCFAHSGHKGRLLYDPELKPQTFQSTKEYRQNKGTAINHFYEKLLLLKDKLNTETAKRIGEERHRFLELFLKQFFKEWEGSA